MLQENFVHRDEQHGTWHAEALLKARAYGAIGYIFFAMAGFAMVARRLARVARRELAGVPAMGFFSAPADGTIAEFRAKGITHVVLGDFNIDPWRSQSMASAVATHSRAFHRLYTAGVFTVYAFDSAQALP